MAGPGELVAVFWGTYDLGKPRNRILRRALAAAGVRVIEIHRDVWRGAPDKSRLGGGRLLAAAARWLAAYPGLAIRYLRCPRHHVVLVGYLGVLDALAVRPLAALRRVPVVWDAFLSLYDTVVEDRALAPRRSLRARLLFRLERRAGRAADRVLLDTRAHAEHVAATFGLPPGRTAALPLGAELERFPPRRPERSERPADGAAGPAGAAGAVKVLFYGQLIPLHGVETILAAARATAGEGFEWTLVGRGQEEGRVRDFLARHRLEKVRWIPWVPYGELAAAIHAADVCLGIFGATGKAGRVIPNKVYQVLAAGVPLVTRDSAALRELLAPEEPGLYLVPPGDPAALAGALRRFAADRPRLAGRTLFAEVRRRIEPAALGARLAALLREAVEERAS
jgi:glycosyltransferase involved in cell wall biosynthesis